MKNILQLFFLLISLSGFSQMTLNDSLVACYSLAGNGFEPVNNLTATLSSVNNDADRFNVPNECLHFNGNISSIVTLPDDPRLKCQAMTVSAWAYPENGVGSYIVFAKNNFNSYHEAYTISIDYWNSVFNAAKVNNNGVYYAISGPITLYTWYHLVTVVDTNSVKLYVNGVLTANTPAPGPIDYEAGKPVRIGGCAENYFPAPFTGKIDNVRFYNRLLNASEILQLYQIDPRCHEEEVPTGLLVNKNNNSRITCFPNPASDVLRFTNVTEDCNVEVSNALGQVIIQKKISPADPQVELEQLFPGVYFAKIERKGLCSSIKFVKE